MPSLKGNKLLSPTELQRLNERESIDKRIRATNDVRVKRKFRNWLENVGHVLSILHLLPEDQIRSVTSDDDIYLLFNVIQELLNKRQFYPIEGKAETSDEWQIVIDENIKQPAKNSDIIRSALLGYYISDLKYSLGSDNPIGKVEFLERLDKDPDFHDRITDEERKAINRLKQARKEFYEERGWPSKEDKPPK
jgi:hypothetical protein